MKNPKNVKPTQFMKTKDRVDAIRCNPNCGPTFGHIDFTIFDQTESNISKCYISNNKESDYAYNKKYGSSLFVDTGPADKDNYFSVLDCEVFELSNYEEYIENVCKHPDLVLDYIKTKKLDEKKLEALNDTEETILKDFNTIHCTNPSIYSTISEHYLTEKSNLLSETQILDRQYDKDISKWFGKDCKFKLIYRASDYRYTLQSFHNNCDSKNRLLVIIKSTGGWIFGGYTSLNWKSSTSSKCIFFLSICSKLL